METVISNVSLHPVLFVKITDALPVAIPVTTPRFETVNFEVFEDTHALLEAAVVVAVNVI